MRRREHQSGFGTTAILLVVLVVAGLAVTGLVLYQHHKPGSAKNSAATSTTQTASQPQSAATSQTQTTSQPQNTTTAQPAPTVAYLQIKEWGVKLPLSDKIKDAYYTATVGTSKGADGQPNQFSLGLTSLNSSGCAVANKAAPVLLFRASLTETDPVSGKLVSQESPGTTIGNYFYGYSLTKNKTCNSNTTFQNLDSAFTTSVKGIIKATSTGN